MLKNIFLIGCMLTALGGYAQTGTNPKGSLFIIGGGNRSDALMQQLVEAAAINDKDYIIVLPMSSEQPDAGFDYFSKQMNRLTGAFIRNFDYKKHDVSDPIWADSLAKAKLIYILGGDQSRFMKVVLNTPVYAAIHKAFANGATIAGTSAGAAVMSRYMITGRQLRDTVYKETFDKLWDSNIEFTEGLGLL
jgi:cyanophycinase